MKIVLNLRGENLKNLNVMEIASKNVFSLPQTSTIMSALKSMLKRNFRRVPIADAGTKRLQGIISATDLINFFGGGDKHKLVEERYDGNLSAAVNAEIKEIMEKNVIVVRDSDTIKDAVELMFKRNVGGCPIVNKDNILTGIITERDILEFLSKHKEIDGNVSDYMTKGVITVNPNETIRMVMKKMIEKKFRRLPIINEGILIGMVTVRELLKYFGREAFKKLITGDIKDVIDRPISTLIEFFKEPLTFPPDARISQIVSAMIEKGYGSALIVEDQKLVGIITERDIVRFLYTL